MSLWFNTKKIVHDSSYSLTVFHYFFHFHFNTGGLFKLSRYWLPLFLMQHWKH